MNFARVREWAVVIVHQDRSVRVLKSIHQEVHNIYLFNAFAVLIVGEIWSPGA
jgi:hypothetical protein